MSRLQAAVLLFGAVFYIGALSKIWNHSKELLFGDLMEDPSSSWCWALNSVVYVAFINASQLALASFIFRMSPLCLLMPFVTSTAASLLTRNHLTNGKAPNYGNY